MMAHLFLRPLSWISKFLLTLKKSMFKFKKKNTSPSVVEGLLRAGQHPPHLHWRMRRQHCLEVTMVNLKSSPYRVFGSLEFKAIAILFKESISVLRSSRKKKTMPTSETIRLITKKTSSTFSHTLGSFVAFMVIINSLRCFSSLIMVATVISLVFLLQNSIEKRSFELSSLITVCYSPLPMTLPVIPSEQFS